MLTPAALFDLPSITPPLRALLDVALPWHILAKLDAFVATTEAAQLGTVHPSAVLVGAVYVAEGAVIDPHAYIEGPAWIGPGATVGHGATLRGGVVLGPGARVGAKSEVKRTLLLDGAKVPHLNYVGDSVVGRNANLGAGVKVANFHAFAKPIKVAGVETGLHKFGAAIGDEVSIGCNAVLSPGTLVGPRSVVYHGVMLRGVVAADTVVKLEQTQVQVPRR